MMAKLLLASSGSDLRWLFKYRGMLLKRKDRQARTGGGRSRGLLFNEDNCIWKRRKHSYDNTAM